MRKAASLLTVLMLFCVLAMAQTRTVTGTVRDAQGNPVPFATVTEAGNTKNAVQADASGNYTIKVGDKSRITFSATGYTSNTVDAGAATSVVLSRSGAENLQEVVVTALGIRKKPEEIGYATSRVSPEQITAGRSFNVAQALSGKVSGLTISNTSSGVNQSPRIVLRGLRSLTGTNTALIVLDGVAVPSNTINYLNPNDVERIDVLKGGQAATLFGSEGVNGAIVITTKKGTGRPEVTFSHTSNVEKLAYMARTQHNFGSGSGYGGNTEENFHPAENQQYGAPYDGSMRPLGRVLEDGSYQLLPYSDIKDARDKLWATGYTAQTDFSYRAGDANSSFFASYQNVSSTGIVYDDKFNRNTFRLNAGRAYNKFNLGFDATYAWDHQDRTNADFYFTALNTPSWVPIDTYRNWQSNKFGEPNGYYNDYYNSPWWEKDNERFFTRSNYFNGNVRLTFKPIQAVELTGRIGIASTNGSTEVNENRFDFTTWAQHGAYLNHWNSDYDNILTGSGRYFANSTPIIPGGISESFSRGTRVNADLFGTYRKEFGNMSLNATLGTSARSSSSEAFATSTNGLLTPGFFDFSNSSLGQYESSNSTTEERRIGGYVDATLGFRNFVYLHAAYRRDYTSKFYDPRIGFDDGSFDTYGADVSFIATDAFPSLKNKVLDNLKIRASYNRNGNDNLAPHSLQSTVGNTAGFPHDGVAGYGISGTIVVPGLTPEIVKTGEVGIEAGFFRNRIALEASYFSQRSNEQIIPVQISPATGYQTALQNAADVKNWGFEFDVKANAVRNKNWNVSLNANYSQNRNEVVDLNGPSVDRLVIQSSTIVSLDAQKGQMFPYLRTSAFQRDSLGRVVVSATDGWPLRATDFAGQGTTLPIHVLGAGVNVGYKGFTFIANAEYRAGHLVFHNVGSTMTFTGSGAITTIYNRQTFVWPNSVFLNSATGKYEPNTNIGIDDRMAAYQGFGDQSFTRGMAGIGEVYVSSGAFWKLRDVSLGYEIPKNAISGLRFLRGINISVWARNLITILPEDNWYTDPELSNTSGNGQGINTTLNTPPTRQIGGTIRITF